MTFMSSGASGLGNFHIKTYSQYDSLSFYCSKMINVYILCIDYILMNFISGL